MSHIPILTPAYNVLYNRMLPAIFRAAVRNNCPRIAAVLFRLTIRKFRGSPRSRQPQYVVCVLRKAIFDDDMLAVFEHAEHVALYSMSRRMLKYIAEQFLPEHLTDLRYGSQTAEDDLKKQAYRAFLINMLRALSKFFRFDVVLTGNFSYHAEQEFAGALEQIGTPFIALHKESLRPTYLAELYAENYRTHRAPFQGRAILVYNDFERLAEIAGRIIPAERIRITGSPRFDALHQARAALAAASPAKTRMMVVFFFFTRTPLGFLKQTEYHEMSETVQWTTLLQETLSAMARLAKEHPDLDVIVKTKAEKIHTDVLEGMLSDGGALPANLKIVDRGNPINLLMESDAVCGFNTTAVLDALALDLPVVVPRFAEATKPEFQPFIVDFEDAVEYAASPEELCAALYRVACERRQSRAELSPASVRILDRWVGNGDGKASERVRSAVIEEIEHFTKETSNGRKS